MQKYSSKFENKDGISVVKVRNSKGGSRAAEKIIYENVDGDTALFLSGGSTPKLLYQSLARERELNVGAVAMIDERFGKKNHPGGNELMIKKTGLLDSLVQRDVTFYPILQDGTNPRHGTGLSRCAKSYENTVQELFSRYKKRVAILGIGEDGHIASLSVGIQNSKVRSRKFVIDVDDFPGEFRKRITLTFHALFKMSLLIILVFGAEKREALKRMFKKGELGKAPSRFFTIPYIANRTLLITDQKI